MVQIICGIIASRSHIYDAYKAQWIDLIQRVKARLLPIDFYFLYNTGHRPTDDVVVEKHEFHTDLNFPFQEKIIPGILQKTMGFYTWLCEQGIPYTHLIRSNLSSFYRFDRLLLTMEERNVGSHRAVLAHMVNGRYPSGCGALFTRDIIEEVVERFGCTDYGTIGRYDDEILGDFVSVLGNVSIHRYQYVCLSDVDEEKAKEGMKMDHFHYRTKFSNNNPGMGGVEYFRVLKEMYYPSS